MTDHPVCAPPVCLCSENPNRLDDARRFWSLLDMVRYHVRDLHVLLLWIDRMAKYTDAQEKYRQGADAILNKGEKQTVIQQMTCVRKHFVELELSDSVPALDELASNIETMTLGECRGHILGARRVLTDCLNKRVFMYVPNRFAKYAQPLQQTAGDSMQITGPLFPFRIPVPSAPAVSSKPFGENVHRVFDKARFDADQTALCLSSGAFTAAIFHMMRVVEWGVRALGADLGLRKIKEYPRVSAPVAGTIPVRKKPTFKLRPIENATWEMIHNQLRAKIDKRTKPLRPGPTRDAKAGFYSSLLEDFHGFKDAWRNHVMHSREEFKEGAAVQVVTHVERFMGMLATHIER